MTTPTILPADGTWVKATDGTNGAWITGAADVYIGTTAPTASSFGHPLPADGLTVTAPAVVYLRRQGSAAARVLISNW